MQRTKLLMGTNFSGKYRKMLNSLFRVGLAILCNVFAHGCFNGMLSPLVTRISHGIYTAAKQSRRETTPIRSHNFGVSSYTFLHLLTVDQLIHSSYLKKEVLVFMWHKRVERMFSVIAIAMCRASPFER